MAHRFPKKVETLLRQAGWQENHSGKEPVEHPTDFKIFPAASVVIEEFGGLNVGKVDDGVNFATSDIQFDPSLGEGLHEGLLDIEKALGKRLYPLGEFHQGTCWLLIDESGAIYVYSGDVRRFAHTFDTALIGLLLGEKQAGYSDTPID